MKLPPRGSRARRRRAPASRSRSSPPRASDETAPDHEARLEAVMETAADGVVLLDEGGAIASANSAAARLFGYERAELAGMDLSLLLPEFRGAGAALDVEARRKDGSSFPAEVTVDALHAAGGGPLVAVIRDVSERRKAEALLQELQNELIYARRLTTMGELASALAHEINQPFAAVATYVRTARWLLQRKPEPKASDVEDILDRASAQVMRAGEIIRHLREFVTRGESVKTVERLSALVEEAHGLAFVGARQAGVRVTIRAEAANDYVLADRIQIQQVVVNLMRNAVEAMKICAKRELVLSTSLVAANLVRLDVIDTGHGFSEEARATLFEPFKSGKANGMGVGLSISRSIVEAHDGRIWAEPNPDGGAIFRITLPLVELGSDR
ncbi:MAG: PAS domain-containing sensor histidine kinase [Methylocystaceae bacterium]|nr:MAG: PAS domain-containing sensor histidine kinase [Methylocystaceae bacterium]